MFLGCGVAAYSAAIFHLMTHAFFKALLFLAAGSVIHGMGGEQDMRKMGGLRKYMPVTFWTMTAAVFAIAGFLPLAAFLLKGRDSVCGVSPGHQREDLLVCRPGDGAADFVLHVPALVHDVLWRAARGALEEHGAVVHARSDTKLTLEADHAHEPHESPWSMLGPLVILALLSVGGGWIGAGRFGEYLAPSVGAKTLQRPAATVWSGF